MRGDEGKLITQPSCIFMRMVVVHLSRLDAQVASRGGLGWMSCKVQVVGLCTRFSYGGWGGRSLGVVT
jgi:hypothetical protein